MSTKAMREIAQAAAAAVADRCERERVAVLIVTVSVDAAADGQMSIAHNAYGPDWLMPLVPGALELAAQARREQNARSAPPAGQERPS